MDRGSLGLALVQCQVMLVQGEFRISHLVVWIYICLCSDPEPQPARSMGGCLHLCILWRTAIPGDECTQNSHFPDCHSCHISFTRCQGLLAASTGHVGGHAKGVSGVSRTQLCKPKQVRCVMERLGSEKVTGLHNVLVSPRPRSCIHSSYLSLKAPWT